MIELSTEPKAFAGGWGTITADGTPPNKADGTPADPVTIETRPKGASVWHPLKDDAGADIVFSGAGYANFKLAGPAEIRASAAYAVPLILGLGFDPTRPYEH